MLEALIKTEIPLRKTLTEFKADDLIDSIDFDDLKNLLKALEPVKIAVENLSRKDSTLISADTIIDFMLNKLLDMNNHFSMTLYENLKRRIDERMNKELMALVRSLKDLSVLPTKAAINFAGNLASRLFCVSNVETTNEVELNPWLKKDESPLIAHGKCKWLKNEFTLFKNTGQRTDHLQKLYNAVLSIKPTSTDVERFFTICTNFCTKIRLSLSDKSLTALAFFKFYYNKSGKKKNVEL